MKTLMIVLTAMFCFTASAQTEPTPEELGFDHHGWFDGQGIVLFGHEEVYNANHELVGTIDQLWTQAESQGSELITIGSKGYIDLGENALFGRFWNCTCGLSADTCSNSSCQAEVQRWEGGALSFTTCRGNCVYDEPYPTSVSVETTETEEGGPSNPDAPGNPDEESAAAALAALIAEYEQKAQMCAAQTCMNKREHSME